MGNLGIAAPYHRTDVSKDVKRNKNTLDWSKFVVCTFHNARFDSTTQLFEKAQSKD